MAPVDRPRDHPTHQERSTPDVGSGQQDSERVETLSYRRAPKLPVFLVLGGVLGAVAGMVLGVVGSGNAMFTTGQVVGYMIVIFALLGLTLGAVVALMIDRISLKRSRQVSARVELHPGERRTQAQDPTDDTNTQVGRDSSASSPPPNPSEPDVRD